MNVTSVLNILPVSLRLTADFKVTWLVAQDHVNWKLEDDSLHRRVFEYMEKPRREVHPMVHGPQLAFRGGSIFFCGFFM